MAGSAAMACAETPSHSRGPGNIRVRVRPRVSFTTGAVWSAILAIAWLLVELCERTDRNIRHANRHTHLGNHLGGSETSYTKHFCGKTDCTYDALTHRV